MLNPDGLEAAVAALANADLHAGRVYDATLDGQKIDGSDRQKVNWRHRRDAELAVSAYLEASGLLAERDGPRCCCGCGS